MPPNRQISLLPEDELSAWAETLLPPARGTLQRLKTAAQAADAGKLEALIQGHLALVESAQEHNEFIDLARARELAAAATRLTGALDTLAPRQRIIAAAAVLYFVTSDDAEDDLASSVGFDDDAEVLESAFVRLGLSRT